MSSLEIPVSARIYVAGHRGLVGSAVRRRLEREGLRNLLTASRAELDLRDQAAVDRWFDAHRPEYAFLVAGTVGGSWANSRRPAEFILESSHVLPAMIRKFHQAKLSGAGAVTLWGTGAPRREFLHVDDLADACLFLMREYAGDEHVNVGTGEGLAIRDLAELVRDVVAPKLAIEWDATKPDGSPRKLLDVSRLHELGWRHRVEVEDGIASTYRWFLAELARGNVRGVPAPGENPAQRSTAAIFPG